MTIAGTITDTGTGNSITVNDNDANTAPNIVTFSGTVAADTLYIGTATTAGTCQVYWYHWTNHHQYYNNRW
jgi:hypothetical protein